MSARICQLDEAHLAEVIALHPFDEEHSGLDDAAILSNQEILKTIIAMELEGQASASIVALKRSAVAAFMLACEVEVRGIRMILIRAFGIEEDYREDGLVEGLLGSLAVEGLKRGIRTIGVQRANGQLKLHHPNS